MFGPTPAELDAARRAHFSQPSPNAVRAVYLFRNLSAQEREGIRNYLEESFVPLNEWLAELDLSVFQVLCLGEDHRPATREFLADQFFSAVHVDVLMLEATTDELRVINEALIEGKADVPLLEADIATVINSARTRNRDVVIAAIEETSQQREERQRGQNIGFRDDTITRNFWRNGCWSRSSIAMMLWLYSETDS